MSALAERTAVLRAGSLAEIVASDCWVSELPVGGRNYDCMFYDGMDYERLHLLTQAG